MAKPLFSHLLNLGTPTRSAYLGTVTTANKTLTPNDEFTVVDTTGGGVTLTLPLAQVSRGRQLLVTKKVAANTVTIQRAGADVITYGALTSITLTAIDDHAALVSDGTSTWVRFI